LQQTIRGPRYPKSQQKNTARNTSFIPRLNGTSIPATFIGFSSITLAQQNSETEKADADYQTKTEILKILIKTKL